MHMLVFTPALILATTGITASAITLWTEISARRRPAPRPQNRSAEILYFRRAERTLPSYPSNIATRPAAARGLHRISNGG